MEKISAKSDHGSARQIEKGAQRKPVPAWKYRIAAMTSNSDEWVIPEAARANFGKQRTIQSIPCSHEGNALLSRSNKSKKEDSKVWIGDLEHGYGSKRVEDACNSVKSEKAKREAPSGRGWSLFGREKKTDVSKETSRVKLSTYGDLEAVVAAIDLRRPELIFAADHLDRLLNDEEYKRLSVHEKNDIIRRIMAEIAADPEMQVNEERGIRGDQRRIELRIEHCFDRQIKRINADIESFESRINTFNEFEDENVALPEGNDNSGARIRYTRAKDCYLGSLLTLYKRIANCDLLSAQDLNLFKLAFSKAVSKIQEKKELHYLRQKSLGELEQISGRQCADCEDPSLVAEHNLMMKLTAFLINMPLRFALWESGEALSSARAVSENTESLLSEFAFETVISTFSTKRDKERNLNENLRNAGWLLDATLESKDAKQIFGKSYNKIRNRIFKSLASNPEMCDRLENPQIAIRTLIDHYFIEHLHWLTIQERDYVPVAVGYLEDMASRFDKSYEKEKTPLFSSVRYLIGKAYEDKEKQTRHFIEVLEHEIVASLESCRRAFHAINTTPTDREELKEILVDIAGDRSKKRGNLGAIRRCQEMISAKRHSFDKEANSSEQDSKVYMALKQLESLLVGLSADLTQYKVLLKKRVSRPVNEESARE